MNITKTGRGLGIFLLITGSGHFLFPAPLDEIVPPFLPFDPRFWTYLSGFAEFAIGLLLLMPVNKSIFGKNLRLIGALSAFALFIIVYPANIYMAIDWLDRPFSEAWVAWARLPLQFGLFYWSLSIAKKIRTQIGKNA
jgi:uncharacterized membrane protein